MYLWKHHTRPYTLASRYGRAEHTQKNKQNIHFVRAIELCFNCTFARKAHHRMLYRARLK